VNGEGFDWLLTVNLILRENAFSKEKPRVFSAFSVKSEVFFGYSGLFCQLSNSFPRLRRILVSCQA